MEKGICLLSLVPLRAGPSSTSELVTQLLFGESYEIIERHNDWVKITTTSENYIAWISQNQVSAWDQSSENVLLLRNFPFTIASNQINNTPLYLLPGSILHNLKFDVSASTFEINQNVYDISLGLDDIRSLHFQEIGLYATLFLKSPYLWGGRSMWGIDCSGYTQLVYKAIGVQLPRDAYQQAECGQFVDFVNESKLGDLAFFENESGKISHVGMILEPGEIIHSSGMVRRDVIDSYGIFDEKLGKHTHKLKCVKRII
ncbi:MAG: C40 family peptidase [bacterium]|nr:C40 family peptidase [bacterium]